MNALGELLDPATGERDSGDVLVYLDGAGTTRGELIARAAELERELRDAHLAGRAIGIVGPNAPATIAAWFAVWRSGNAFVPLNPRVPPAERERSIESAGVAAVLDPISGALRLTGAAAPRRVEAGEAIIQFTSGTTGRPKAVPLRHDIVLELLDGVIGTVRGTGSSARAESRAPMPNLVPVSLSLWAGIYQVLFAFRLGAPVVLMDRFSAAEFARLVRTHGIRSSVLPPAAMVMLLQDPSVTSLEPLRYVRSVSAPLSPMYARQFHDRFGVGILNGYGQTELGGEVVGWSAADWKQFGTDKLGAVGRPHAGIEVRVVDGELQVRSANADELTERFTADGWLRTGDLARIDDDGFVWIDGRISSMINRGGLKVFPDEVEEHLRELAGVRDAAVAGVADDRLGEVPWAFLVLEHGHTIDAETLREWCRERMAPYKVPAGVTVVSELPRNEIGKLLRQDLVTRAEADRAASR